MTCVQTDGAQRPRCYNSKHMRDFKGQLRGMRLLVTGIGVILLVTSLSVAGASSANISKSYSSREPIANGSLVSLDPKTSDYVIASNTDNGMRLIGVAVKSSESLLAVDSEVGKIQVATSGNATVLVSTLNGPIKVGDQIAVSPFNGIGMKSVAGSHIIGLAQTDLNDSTKGTVSKQVTNKSGKQTNITVGLVRVTIGVGTDTSAGSGHELSTLQKAAQSLTGRVVPTSRIVMSLIIAVIALLALVTLIYGAIYGSIISIGRNPLARYAVFRSLGSVLLMSGVMALLAGVIIFFLLR